MRSVESKIVIDINKNWRTPDGGFETDIACNCGRQTEVYVDISYDDPWTKKKLFRMCKGCLGEIEDRINDAYIEHIKEGKRI
jgi:hypothetical protein